MARFLSGALVLFMGAACAAQPVAPLGRESFAARSPIKAAKEDVVAVDCLSPERAALWTVEFPTPEAAGPAFQIDPAAEVGELHLHTGRMEPHKTTVRIVLPGDAPANGAVWARSQANYLSFWCKGTRPARLTCHLLEHGKSAGTFQAGFAVTGPEWTRVVIPFSEFGVKSVTPVAGLGFRIAAAADAEVAIKAITVGRTPYSDASWHAREFAINLAGTWRFAADPADVGQTEGWYRADWDDAGWKPLQTGRSWEEQGVVHAGWGWYRQTLLVPKELAGTPLTLTLSDLPSDDDVWLNGQRIGGLHGEYKYTNWLTRSYTVDAPGLRYGEKNTVAIRVWGGDLTFIGQHSGLAKTPLMVRFDPYPVRLRLPGGVAVPAECFDLSEAQRGQPFEFVFSFPSEVAAPDAQLRYQICDAAHVSIAAGRVPLTVGDDGNASAVAVMSREAAQTIYLRGRLRIRLTIVGREDRIVYVGERDLDHLNFARRDESVLAALPPTLDDTPYGKLKLIDEIDPATSLLDESHPYLESGFDAGQLRVTPGSDVPVQVTEILGRRARESTFGWFAYRVGRGRLKPHATYLLRIEYPEDKPRYCPIEIQTGQNYMDVGWRNGVGPDDVYDNWPLSKTWQWYDVIVPLDDETVGTGGTGTARAETGFWVYFMNKRQPDGYYAIYSGGPAIGRIKLYEIDPEQNRPVIRRPAGLPQRVLSFDWERQPDHDPYDLVRYARLMGYSAISPVILKWAFANYAEPLNGYTSTNIDAQNYWAKHAYVPGKGAARPAVAGKPSVHARYLEATKRLGIDYIPRIEWGGSLDLPREAWATDPSGHPTKPNRFGDWCSNLLDARTWDDLKTLMDHLIGPYVQDNPQLAGVLWRIRCNRVPISYGQGDLELFSRETGVALPRGGVAQWAAWATGEGKAQYDAWWHRKRAEFHRRLADLLQSYRPGLELYYFNWDPDKFSLIEPDTSAWAFLSAAAKPPPDGGRTAYERDRATRKSFTADDYISVLRSGDFGRAFNGVNRADLGLRTELYHDTQHLQLFAPVSQLCFANLPEYLNYFRTPAGLAVSYTVPYDEVASRTINPKYEGNMITPAGAPFSLAFEVLAYFHGDARTLNYTAYTYGRGFAAAHRRFAQAFLALPAIPGAVVVHEDADVRVRSYPSANGVYVGVAYKGYAAKTLSVSVPASGSAKVLNLVTGEAVAATFSNGQLRFEVASGPMELNAFLVH